MEPISLRGMGVALATPFKDDFSIDFDALENLVDYQIKNGADYLVVLATTSEAVTLSCSERNRVARFVAEKVAGRIPLVMGMSNNCTTEIVNHIPEVDFSGYSAILSVVPYYNKPSQEGIYRHFKAIAEVSPLPVILYNVPSRTGKNMEAATTLRLAREFPGKIIGIKEASGNLEQAADIIAGKPAGFNLISGDDALTRRLIAKGATGVISVVGNALPRMFSTMVHLALSDASSEKAARIDCDMQPLDRALFAEGNPTGLKCLLAHLGLAKNVVRLPLVPVSPETSNAIAEALDTLGIDRSTIRKEDHVTVL
ncbi:MAG: 4-hydroxy-tetrahydrodipicolinate synthase [Bacteroidales bacterium]|nr:4-hydroxy-tetrahydrodipicolinate synthase [Bacteroidales bacterium]